MYRADTIVACATASGRGAVAIVRLSGRQAFSIADRIVHLDAPGPPRPWRLQHGVARDTRDGCELDEVLAVRMPGPRSYTGEDVVEIHCHGSPLVVELLIATATHAGARPAERGEFTRRAVLNGRMDLLQAEAVADLVEARVAGGAALAWTQLQGALSRRLKTLRERILSVLADVEANVDFSDDELPVENVEARLAALSSVAADLTDMLSGFPAARRWREGHRIVFAGRPNVGKSSLVNALLGYGRMIVSEEPGTTRDSVEELVDLHGAAFVLIDTAGVRDAPGRAEAEAVARAREHADSADILIHVLDAGSAISPADRELLARAEGRQRVIVLNKIDLGPTVRAHEIESLVVDASPIVETSAVTGVGCDELVRCVVALAGSQPHGQPPAISRVRHRAALESTRVSVAAAAELLSAQGAPELICIELRAALDELAGVTEPVDNEDVLDLIFSEFCIGK